MPAIFTLRTFRKPGNFANCPNAMDIQLQHSSSKNRHAILAKVQKLPASAREWHECCVRQQTL